MSLKVTLGGKDVTDKVVINPYTGSAAPSSFSFDIAPAKDFTITMTSTNSGTLSYGWPTAVAKGSGWAYSPVPRPELSEADQRMIDEFLIESFARGFAREQAARD